VEEHALSSSTSLRARRGESVRRAAAPQSHRRPVRV